MKLDKIKFARLIAYIQLLKNSDSYAALQDFQVEHVDNIVDVDVPVSERIYTDARDVNMLMALMAAGDAQRSVNCLSPKIEAIKLHRKLTGWGLKESKDQVEKYWVSKTPVAPGLAYDHSLATSRMSGGD